MIADLLILATIWLWLLVGAVLAFDLFHGLRGRGTEVQRSPEKTVTTPLGFRAQERGVQQDG